MRPNRTMLWTAVGAIVAAAGTARADEDASWASRIELHAFASVAYTLNANRPDDRLNRLRSFDFADNQFTPDVAELVLLHSADAPGEVGFRVDAVAGSAIPRVTAASGLFRNTIQVDPTTSVTVAEDFDLQQAYASWVVPGAGLKLDVGKFVTWAGAELIEGYDGFNDNYSRSFLFGFAIPFTHTGIRLIYPVNRQLALGFMLVNGWDNVTDSNDGKTWGVFVGLTPTERLAIALLYIGGPEQAGEDGNLRHLLDFIATLSISSTLSFTLNADFGTEKDVPTGGPPLDATWYGVAAYFRIGISDDIGLNLRGELFRDDGGARTGVDQSLFGLTLTPHFRLNDAVTFRVDLRFDHSSEQVFLEGSDPTANQLTLAANLLAAY